MKRKILSLLLTFCLALIPGLCVNAENASATTGSSSAPAPYHVDLTDFFEADIFYDTGDTDTSIGFDATGLLTSADTATTNTAFAFPRSVVTGSSYLNNGVLSFSGTDIILSYGYKSVHSNLGCIDLYQSGTESHGSNSCKATAIFQAAVPTLSFDASAIADTTRKNAVVIPHDAETKPKTQTISGVFSGMETKYLTFLFAVPNEGGRQKMSVTYTDGTNEEYIINHNSSQNSNAIGGLQAVPMYYDTTEGATGWKQAYDNGTTNYTKLVACAIDTHDKAISSIVLTRVQYWNSGQYRCQANLPILAITEIPSSSECIEEIISEYINSEAAVSKISDSASYLEVKNIVKYKETLDERNYTISDATVLEKITKLQKQYNALKPHMVDLTGFFNRDVFAKEGETVAEGWGWTDIVLDSDKNKIGNLKSGINLDNIKTSLSNGILSENAVAKVVGANTGVATNDELAASVAETPFDLSHINEEGNNVVVNDDGAFAEVQTYITTMIEQNEEKTVFSGKPADYLVILQAMGRDTSGTTYTVYFTDGTEITQTTSYGWSGNYYSKCVVNAYEKLYLPESSQKATLSAVTADPYFNRVVLIADAIPLGGKTIKSVKKYGDAWNGALPLLAMTEVSGVTALADREAELTTLVNALPSNLNTSEAYLNYKSAKVIADELADAGWELDSALTAKLSSLEAQYEAVKPHMVDLTGYFNRDIFANEGVAQATGEGYINGTYDGTTHSYTTTAVAISDMTALLNDDGVFSDSAVVTVKENANKALMATNAELAAEIPETPFDLSAITDEKNAIVRDVVTDDDSGVWGGTVKIEQNEENTVFSNKPSEYIVILQTIGRSSTLNSYVIEFTDGSKTSELQTGYAWMGQEVSNGYLINKLGNRLYLAGEPEVWTVYPTDSDWNKNGLAATAIRTDGKTIKNITVKTAINSDYATCAPILAMTEVFSLTANEDDAAELDLLINGKEEDTEAGTEAVEGIGTDIENVTEQEMALEAIELAAKLTAAGYVLSDANAAAIANYKKQLAGLEPHMVDLSGYFNRDIFATDGEAVDTDWGFIDGMMPINSEGSQDSDNVLSSVKTGLIEADVEEVLTDGIFSENEVAAFFNGNNTTLLDQAALSEKIIKTPFDISAMKEEANAIAIDTIDEQPCKIESGFSGNVAKYLLILTVSGRNDCNNTYEITYTDGTTETFATSSPWAGAIQSTYAQAAAAFMEKAYYKDGKAVRTTGGTGGNSYPNRSTFTATALDISDKAIASVKVLAHAWGIAPILAMTEIPLDYSDLCEDLNMDWDFKTFTTENADDVIKLTDAAIELYERSHSDVEEADYPDYAYANIKAKAIKEVGDDTIYVVNSFSEADGKVTANVTLTNTSSEEKNYILIMAAYSESGEKLEALIYDDSVCTLSGDYMTSTDISDSASIDVNSDATTYKLFVWENLSSLKPIATFTK